MKSKIVQIVFLFSTLISTQLFSQNRCGSELNVQKLKQNNPASYDRLMQLEKFITDYKQRLANGTGDRLIDQNGKITIPVVVHVIHSGEAIGTGRNLSDARIANQIAILNQDFNRLNADKVNTPSVFLGVAGNLNIDFVLACTNPNGSYTTGINRLQSSTANFTASNGDSPAKHANQGGVDAWPTDRYLNIWVCSIEGTGLGGISTFPQDFSANPNIDGVLVHYAFFGTGGGSQFFNSGRTTTHEVGHWLGLRHIWGDEDGCSSDDFCGDTPKQQDATPSNITPVFGWESLKSCGNNGDMFMNFMDFTADQFMNLFTKDQVTNMRAIFQTGGARESFTNNAFILTQAYPSCTGSGGFYVVRTAFCAANGNINWSVTGPATLSSPNGHTTANYVLPQSGVNGTVTVTASWNNIASSFSFPIFSNVVGTESTTYNPNYNNSGNIPTTTGSTNMTSYNNWTYLKVAFSGATGPAKNWRLVSSTSTTYILNNGGTGNTSGVYLTQPYALAKIRAEIPTPCGDRTIEYSFLGGYLNIAYTVSPNPATNRITVSALGLAEDPNARVSNPNAYEVHIFNSFNQLLKKMACPRGSNALDIDVSSFPSNQFYTVKLISDNDVQTKSFFKQ